MVTGIKKTTWKPDFSKTNPYEGMPPEYVEMVAETFVPTADNPYSPIERAIQQGWLSKDLSPIVLPSMTEPALPITEPMLPIPTGVTPSAIIPIPDTDQMLNADYSLVYKDYQRTGGKLDVTNWISAGTPLRPEQEYENELRILNDVYTQYPGYTKDIVPIKIAELQTQFNTNPMGFLEDLTLRTTPENVTRVLGMIGITQDMLLSVLPPERQDRRLTETIQAVFPEYTIEDFNYLIENEWDTFIKEIRKVGGTEEKKALLKLMGYSDERIELMLPEPPLGLKEFRPITKPPKITTPAGNVIDYPMTDAELESMTPPERVAYQANPQQWLTDRPKWSSLRTETDRIKIVLEALGYPTSVDTTAEQMQLFMVAGLEMLGFPRVLPKGEFGGLYLLGKGQLPKGAKASLEVAEQFLKRIANIRLWGKAKVPPETLAKVKQVLDASPEELSVVKAKVGMPEVGVGIKGKAANIRLDKFNEDIRPIIKDWADTHPIEVQEARRGVISDAQVRMKAEQLVSEVGGDLDKLRTEWKPGVSWNAEELTAIRGSLAEKTSSVLEAQKLVLKDASTENLLKLEMAVREQAAVQETVHGLTAEAGRALRSFRQSFAEAGTDAQKMEALLKKVGGKDNAEKIAKLLGQLDVNDPIAVNKFIQSLSKPHIGDYLTEIFYNSILSGPKTHIVNSLSNTFNAIFSPIERTVSALVDLPLSAIQGRARQRFFNEVSADVFGAIKGIPDGFRQFAYVIKNGISLDEITKWEQRTPAFKGKLGAVVTFPSRMLQGADALMKSVNMRAAINAEAHRIASISKLTGKAFDDRVAELLSNPTAEMLAEATKVAEYRLFRAPLGKTGQALMKARESVDILGVKPGRFLVPFIRTPMNLVKYGLERTPLGFGNPKLWQNLATKNPEAADQLARAVIGSIGVAAIAWYAKEGKITGAPPRSAAERERFYREGKQPYAIRVGEFWVSYQRLEPFNQLLSQVAIIVDAIQSKDKTAEKKIEDAVNTFGQNFVSQTYMSSLSDLLNMLAEPERYAGNWLNRFAMAMVVPMSSASRTAAQMLDDVVRDPQNVFETIEANIPGLSKNVQAKITALGEDVKRKSPPWFPINVTPVEETVLSQELERLKVNVGMASTTIKGVKLSEQEQVGYQKLVGTAIKTDLEKLMLAPDYWTADDITKNKMIDSVISTARDRASIKMREQMFTTGSTEERIVNVVTALKEADSQLGKVLSATPEFSHEPPNIYDLAGELDTSYKTLLTGIPEGSLKGKDIPPTVHSWYEKEADLVTKNSLRNKSLIQLNADPKLGSTYEDYFNQWQQRSQITDETELAAFDKKNPDAYLGNFSRRTLDILKQFYSLSRAEQTDFLYKNLDLMANPREDWLISDPKANAQLVLWGEGRLLTKEAYDEYIILIKELDVVDSVLPKDTIPKNLSSFLLTTEKTYREITQKIEVLGGITDEKLRKVERDKLYQTEISKGVTYIDVSRKVEAIEVGTDETPTPDEFVNGWVDRGRIVDEHGGSSSEVMSWLSDNLETYRWALDNELLSDDGGLPDDDPRILEKGRVSEEWNIPSLKITEKWRELLDEKASWSDPDSDTFIPANAAIMVDGKEVNARDAKYQDMLDSNPDFRDDMRRQDVYNWYGTDRIVDDAIVEAHVRYSSEITDIDKGNSFQGFLWRYRDPDYDAFRTNVDIFGENALDPLDLDKLPIWEIDEQYITEDAEYQAILDANEGKEENIATQNYLFPGGQPTPYAIARYTRNAYEAGVPSNYISDYADYYTNPALIKPDDYPVNTSFWEDDWWMMEHPDFYKEVYMNPDYWDKPHERWDYRLVPPTRAIGADYIGYKRLLEQDAPGMTLDQYRFDHRAMDEWGVSVGIWEMTMSEKRRHKGLTPLERAKEEASEQREEWERQLDEIERILGGLK